jgi:hypothetical protein
MKSMREVAELSKSANFGGGDYNFHADCRCYWKSGSATFSACYRGGFLLLPITNGNSRLAFYLVHLELLLLSLKIRNSNTFNQQETRKRYKNRF